MNKFEKNWNGLTLHSKKLEYSKIAKKYPTHIPVIVFASNDIQLDKNKYLLTNDITVGHFMCILRKRIKLNEDEAIFILVGNKGVMAPSSQLIHLLYKEHKNECGFLYFTILKESTFGSSY
jgi:GABA(A) receptor-associated protein